MCPKLFYDTLVSLILHRDSPKIVKLEHDQILSVISILKILIPGCQYSTARMKSGQQRVFDECHVISLTVVNINSDTFSWGHLYSSAAEPQ